MQKKSIFTTIFTIFFLFNLNAQKVNITLEAHNVWGDNSGYQLLLDATATQYGVAIPVSGPMSEICFPPEDLYDIFSAKVPTDAFPSCKTTTVVANGKVTIQIPAGVYDWCITNPDPLVGRIWMAGGNGENASIRDNYLFEEGKDYHFLMKIIGMWDGVVITITDAGKPCPAVTNVTASAVDGNKVKLTWIAPPDKALLNYKIYQNGTESCLVSAETTEWTSDALASGSYTFAVAAVYAPTDDCVPVKVAVPTIQILTCDRTVTHLTVDYDKECTAAELRWNAPEKTRSAEIFNNGPFITHPGQGADGADASAYNAPFSSIYGVGANILAGYMIGDDFTLDDDYSIETIDFFAYQFNAGATSTITGVFVQIYDGSPMEGGTLIWGNTTTNRLLSTSYTNVNRVSQSNLIAPNRRIMKVTAEIGTVLFAGIHYWLAWGFTGSLSDGPSQIPVTIFGQPETGNGITKTPAGWEIAQDQFTSAIYDFVFTIHGEPVTNQNTKYNVYRDGIKIAGPIDEPFYTDQSFDKTQPHTWSVAVVCVNGGDSEWVSMEKDICIYDNINELTTSAIIYPNPASTTVTIKTENFLRYEIYNTLGQLIKTGNTNTVDVSACNAGVYFFKIFDVDSNMTARQVVVVR